MDSKSSGLMDPKYFRSKKVLQSFIISNGSLKKQVLFRNQILKSLEKKKRKKMKRIKSLKGFLNTVREERTAPFSR